MLITIKFVDYVFTIYSTTQIVKYDLHIVYSRLYFLEIQKTTAYLFNWFVIKYQIYNIEKTMKMSSIKSIHVFIFVIIIIKISVDNSNANNKYDLHNSCRLEKL